MNTEILVRKIADLHGISISLSREIVRTFLDEISSSIVDGENVSLKGFGTFKLVEVSERKYTTPNGVVAAGSRKRVRFIPSSKIKYFLGFLK